MWNQLLFWRLSSWLMCWSYKWTSLRHSSAIYQEVKAIKTNCKTENHKHKSFRMSLNKMWNQLLFWRLSSWLMCWSYKWTSLRHTYAICINLPGSQSNQNKLQDWESQTQIVSDVAQQNVESTPLLEVVILVNVLKLQVNIIATHIRNLHQFTRKSKQSKQTATLRTSNTNHFGCRSTKCGINSSSGGCHLG